MPTLTISPRFFQVEKQNYNNWKFAFIRELLQNSLDAGAFDIEFTVESTESGKSKIICKDDGRGMTRDILENVFLTMGETTKTDGTTQGGFGKARNLTCFSSDYYKITSNEYVCEGIGASYEVKETDSHYRGVIFEAVISADSNTLIEKIKEIVFFSRVNAVISLNGEKLSDSYRAGSFCRETQFGRVYANKSNEKIKNKVIVRVNGLVTFINHTDANAGVTVEIFPDKCRDILTATRDNLNYQYSRELEQFLGELCVDTKSALKDRSKRFIKFMNKARGFMARGAEMSAMIMGGAPAESAKLSVFSAGGGESGAAQSYDYREGTGCKCPILESLIIYADTDNEAVKKVIKFYDPSQNNGTIGSDRYKFIKQWAAICKIVSEEAAQLTKTNICYALGFCFDDDAVAMHKRDENVNYLMINPVTKEGKMKYSINSKSDITLLILSACHEITHALGHGLHNQDFVCAYDAILEKVMVKLSEVVRIVKEAKN